MEESYFSESSEFTLFLKDRLTKQEPINTQNFLTAF